MSKQMSGVAIVVALFGLLLGGTSLRADEIRWDDGDGTSGSYSGANFTWDNLQLAIQSAEVDSGAGNAGTVKISGNMARNPGVDTAGDIEVVGGNVKISGGWNAGFSGQSGTSTLNVAATSADPHRVVKVTGADTTLDSLKITGGYLKSGNDGGGIFIEGTSGSPIDNARISKCEITGNTVMAASGAYGCGINIGTYVGSATRPMLIENCKITGNLATANTDPVGHPLWSVLGGGISVNGMYAYTVVANSEVTGNTAELGGAGLHCKMYRARMVVFGSLIADNSNIDGSTPCPGAGIFVEDGYGANHGYNAHFANCTIADNVDSTDPDTQGLWHAGIGAYSYHGAVPYVNSVLAENQRLRVENDIDGGTSSQAARLQRSTIFEPTGLEVYYEAEPGGTDEYDDNLTDALLFTNPRFHSVDDSGADQQTIQNEKEGDPLFVGGGDYQLTAGSNSLDNGLTQLGSHADITGGTGGQFVYVDTDMDTTYDPAWDVIVDLQGGGVTGASAMHLVYETDLLGNPRLDGVIDRGAYEGAAGGGAPIPEPAGLGLVGLALVALKRKRS